MRNVLNRAGLSHGTAVLAACATLLLGGCQLDEAVLDDNYKPITVQERYPIKVEKVPVKMGVAPSLTGLGPDQVNGVINFATDAKINGASAVSVKWPSGSARSRAVAHEIAGILVDQGIPADMIRSSSYPGGAGTPIQMSFLRKVAVTKECGDWSENLAEDPGNRSTPNFGCAYQNNIAAMVANPEDFERPRHASPVLAANRTVVMKVYYENSTAGDYYTLDAVASK